VLAVLEISKCLLLEVTIDEQTLDLLELHEQVFELFVVVLFNPLHLFTHVSKFTNLVFNFVLELGHLVTKVIN